MVVLVYVYAGFALLLVIVAQVRRRQVRQEPITPALSLIIAAYNEERSIAERLDNALSLDYPRELLEIIVVSDGSDDRTEAIVQDYAGRGVRLLKCPRRGKIHALNDAVAMASGEILVFSDATSMYEAQALRMLARNFADPEVGGVGGNVILDHRADSDSVSRGEGLYLKYDKWLKRMESLTGSSVSVNGPIHAIRRRLYQPIAETAASDDFAISTAVIEQGYRLVFESEARAYEFSEPAAEREFGRKVRLMTCGLRGVLLRKALLNPLRYGFYSLELFTHKVLRRLVPLFLIMLFACSLLLSSGSTFFQAMMAAQVSFYVLAACGYLLRNERMGSRMLFCVPFYYCLANLAAFRAVINIVRGRRIERWQTQRQEPSG
jgi:glycosyltransferase involved in cell wall biosynthesis